MAFVYRVGAVIGMCSRKEDVPKLPKKNIKKIGGRSDHANKKGKKKKVFQD